MTNDAVVNQGTLKHVRDSLPGLEVHVLSHLVL